MIKSTFLRKILSLVLAMILCAGLLPVASAKDELADLVERTGAYCYEKIEKPEFGSEWYLFAFAKAAYPMAAAYKTGYYRALCDYLKEKKGVLDSRKHTEYSRAVLTLTALGYDPLDAGGYNLLQPLADFDGTAAQGVNGAAFALLALDSGSYALPQAAGKTQATRDGYIAYILENQLKDGGFALTGTKADTDITAIVLQALAKYRHRREVETAIEKALSYLSRAQAADGSYESLGIPSAESCAQVILALCELGISPEDSRFTKNGVSVWTALLAFQKENSSFAHVKDGKENMIATRQAYLALLGVYRLENGQDTLFSAKPGAIFRDMEGHPQQGAVEALAAAGILSGRGDGFFDPDATMTRAEFAAMIVRGMGDEPVVTAQFTDVDPAAWYAGYVGAAFARGIIKGTSEHTFRPDKTISDTEARVMIARAAAAMGIATSLQDQWEPSITPAGRGDVATLLYTLLGL